MGMITRAFDSLAATDRTVQGEKHGTRRFRCMLAGREEPVQACRKMAANERVNIMTG